MIVVDADRGIDEGLEGMLMRAAAAAGVTYHGPTPAEIRSKRDRLLREQAEKEDAEFVLAMEYACQMKQTSIYSTTAKEPAIVEEKVTNAEGSMTNRIMFTEVMVFEQQAMAGNNMDFHKSRDEITRLVSNDSTGILETEQKAQDSRKKDLKRAAMQERTRREKRPFCVYRH